MTRARGLALAALVAIAGGAACSDDGSAPPTTTTTTTLVAPEGSLDGVEATLNAFTDAYRNGRDTEAAGWFTQGALAATCGTREGVAAALRGARNTTSVVYQASGVGKAYTEDDDGVGVFALQVLEVDPGTGTRYSDDVVTLDIRMKQAADGRWLFDAPMPPTVSTFCP